MQLLKEVKDEQSLILTMNTYEKYLLTGSLESLKVYDIIDFNLVKVVALPGRMVYSIVVYSNYIFVALDSSIYILDSTNYSIISKLHGGHCEQITGLCIAQSNLGDKLFSASRDKTLIVWSLETLDCSQILQRHEGFINSLTSIRNMVNKFILTQLEQVFFKFILQNFKFCGCLIMTAYQKLNRVRS